MPGKGTGGFTKEGQRAKFIRHRDIKLKDKEVRREAHIQKAMIEGICQKCRLIVQWRFKYDKYKPLKNRGVCNDCRQKTVVKAYRSVCDDCSKRRKVCASCCGEITVDNDSMMIDKDGNISEKRSPAPDDCEVADAPAGEFEFVADISGGSQIGVTDETEAIVSELPEASASAISMAAEWDPRQFTTFAASKYDKNRKVGEEVNSVFVFGELLS